MASSLAEFEEALQKLTTKFENNPDDYLLKGHSEAKARMDFVEPSFGGLEIAAAGVEINNHIYEFYGVTNGGRKIIEGTYPRQPI